MTNYKMHLVKLVTTDHDRKYEVAGRMAAAIIKILQNKGSFIPKDLSEKGFSRGEIFVVEWTGVEGKHKVSASFTHGLSTFTGEPIVRVQFTTNNNPPSKQVMANVVASILVTAHEEIDRRKWGKPKVMARKGPLINIHSTINEVRKALILSSQEELFNPKLGAIASNFNTKTPIMRVHALNQSKIVNVLEEMGAEPGLLGPNPMYPIVVDFNNIPEEKLDLSAAPAARPLKVVKSKVAANDPYFALVG